MSMTRKEAIKILQKRQRYCKVIADHANATVKADELREIEAIDIALSALRSFSREQVEKVWRGEWLPYLDGEHIMPERYYRCSKCGDRGYMRKRNFCPHCGAPMTDEAMEILVKRMEELWNG